MYDHGQNTAQRTAMTQLQFIEANLKYLRLVDKKGKFEKAATSMLADTRRGLKLSPGQMDYANGIYEKTMEGIGLPSCGRHTNPRWENLKH